MALKGLSCPYEELETVQKEEKITNWNRYSVLALWKNDFAWYGSNGRNKGDFLENDFLFSKVPPANIQLC